MGLKLWLALMGSPPSCEALPFLSKPYPNLQNTSKENIGQRTRNTQSRNIQPQKGEESLPSPLKVCQETAEEAHGS